MRLALVFLLLAACTSTPKREPQSVVTVEQLDAKIEKYATNPCVIQSMQYGKYHMFDKEQCVSTEVACAKMIINNKYLCLTIEQIVALDGAFVLMSKGR